MLVPGWGSGISWTKVIRADYLKGKDGEGQNVGLSEQAEGIYKLQEETLGIRSWRSCIPEGDPNHWCGKGSLLEEAFS